MSNEAKRIRLSGETLNCYGTWVKTDGVDLEQFRRNPVLLWMHWRGNIIGCIKDIRVEGTDITGEPWFDEVREESRICKQQWDKGTLRMCSPNFEILETSQEPDMLKPGQTRPTITRCKLVEVSMVDIGGNDQNIVLLSHDGGELKLSTGADNPVLPLLRNDTDNNPLKDKDMNELRQIALLMGLPETASLEDVTQEITDQAAARQQLRTELDTLRLAAVTTLVDGAVADGKIGEQNRQHFIELGQTMGADSLRLTLEAIAKPAAPVKPMNLIQTGTNASGAAGQYQKLSEVPADELKLMRKEDPDRYRRLYRAEYGMDCPELND